MSDKKLTAKDKLADIFNSNIVVRKKNNKLVASKVDIDTNLFIDNFKRLYRNKYNSIQNSWGTSMAQVNKRMFYSDYDQMDQDSIISAVLDIFADESVLRSEDGEILKVFSEDGDIQKILENLFNDVLNIEFNLWPWIRNLVKYGDFYLQPITKEGYGVVDFELYSVYDIERREDEKEVVFSVDGTDFKEFEIVHFRLLSDSNFFPYGRSMIEGGRKVWKQLCLAHDTNVWTNTGYKEIQNINSDDIVYTYDYDNKKTIETRIKNVIKTGVKPIYEIRTAHRLINATAEHPVMLEDGTYKQVSDLTLNDHIVINNIQTYRKENDYIPNLFLENETLKSKFDIGYYNEQVIQYKNICEVNNESVKRLTANYLRAEYNLTFIEYKEKYNINDYQSALLNKNRKIPYKDALEICNKFNLDTSKLKIYYKASPNQIVYEKNIKENFKMFSRFFGFMLGDGWIDGNSIVFSIGNRYDKSIKYVKFLNDIGLDCDTNGDYTINTKIVGGVASKYFRLLLESLDFRTGTSNKVVPDWVFKLSKENQIEFLLGFADADGCVVKNGYAIGGINKKLLTQLRILAQQCGLTTTNMTINYASFKENSWGGICKNNTYTFKFGFDGENNKFTKNNTGHLIEKIRKVELKDEPVEVYDIEVDNELHNFIAEGITVHNCLVEDAMLIHRIMRAPEKRIFKIDVGNIPPESVNSYMETLIADMKKEPYQDENGNINLEFNLHNMMEDIYLPVRGGKSGTEIDTLPAPQYDGIEDVEYLRSKLLASMKVPQQFLNYAENNEGKCIHPDTKIPLLNGTILTIKEISELFNTNIDPDLWAYSYDTKTNSIIPSKIKTAEQTRKNAQLIRVYLDNDKYLDCTPDHNLLLKGGELIQAQNLKEGDSLQAIYKQQKPITKNATEYEQIYQPHLNKWIWTHSMVDTYFNGKLERNGFVENKFDRDELIIRHHIDFNRFNNTPSNLIRMRFYDHIKLHGKNCLDNPRWLRQSQIQCDINRLPENRVRSSIKQKENIKRNPHLRYSLRNAWLAKTHEYRSEQCKAAYTDEMREFHSKRCKDPDHIKKLQAGYDKKFPDGKRPDISGSRHCKWIKRPTFDELIKFMKNNKSSMDLSNFAKFNKAFGKPGIRDVIESNKYTVTEWMNYYHGFSAGRSKNITYNHFVELSSGFETYDNFINNSEISQGVFNKHLNKFNITKEYWETNILNNTYNHKVVKIEWLSDKIDTYNLEVDNENHNYLIEAGIVIKNSTLSAMDLRFARTIERIQSVVLSELYNIAYIHLTLQGFSKSDLMKFELELNNPSIIYQQEKLEFLSQKIDVASSMKDLKMFSTDKIYEDIFKMSDDEIREEKSKLKNDVKFESVLTSIEDGEYEGDDDENKYDYNIEDDDGEEEESAEPKKNEPEKKETPPKNVNKLEKVDKKPLKHNFRSGPLGLK